MKNVTLKEQFYINGKFDKLSVYDMHGHMGNIFGIHFPTPDTDSMIKAMDCSGVKMLVFCHHSSLFSPEIGNKVNIEAVKKYPKRLRAYCAINPNYPDIIQKDLKSFNKYYKNTYVGFKFLASYHGYPLTDKRYEPAWVMANNKELLVLLHTWNASLLDGPIPIRKVAENILTQKFYLDILAMENGIKP